MHEEALIHGLLFNKAQTVSRQGLSVLRTVAGAGCTSVSTDVQHLQGSFSRIVGN